MGRGYRLGSPNAPAPCYRVQPVTSGYHAPLYRLVFVGLAATALVVLAFNSLDGGGERHDARLVTSTTAVPGVALVVQDPTPGAHVPDPTVILRGTATPGATVSSGAASTTAAADGTWSLTVELPAGASPVTVRATLAGRSESTMTMTVTRDAAQVMTTTTQRRRRPTTTAPPVTATATTAAPVTTTTSASGAVTTTTTVELPTTTSVPEPTTTSTTATTERPPPTTTTTGG